MTGVEAVRAEYESLGALDKLRVQMGYEPGINGQRNEKMTADLRELGVLPPAKPPRPLRTMHVENGRWVPDDGWTPEEQKLIEAADDRAWDETIRRVSAIATGQPASEPRGPDLRLPERAAYLFRPIEEYLDGVQTEVPWLWHRFPYYGGTSMLAGIWKGGKSQLTASLIRARLEGKAFVGEQLSPGPTYVITEEGGISLYEKYEGVKGLQIVDARAMAFANQTLWDVLESIREAVTGAQAFVVIDTLSVLAGIEDENDAIKVTAAIRQVMNFAQETSAAVLIIDHTGKQTSGLNHGKSIRGSGAKPATLDIYGVLDYGATKTQRKLSIEGRVRDARADLVLDFDPETQDYRLIEHDDQTTYDQQTAAVPSSGDGWLLKDLAALWKLPRTGAQRRVDELVAAGRIRQEWGRAETGNAKAWRYWAQLAPAAPVFRAPKAEDESDGDQ